MSVTRVCDLCRNPGLADNKVRHLYMRYDYYEGKKRISTNMGGIDLCDRCHRTINDKQPKRRDQEGR